MEDTIGSQVSMIAGFSRNLCTKSWSVIESCGVVSGCPSASGLRARAFAAARACRTGLYVSGTNTKASGPATDPMMSVSHAVQCQPRWLSVTSDPKIGPSVGPTVTRT